MPVGRPIDEIQLKIIEWNDSEIKCQHINDISLEHDQVGEICVTGEHVLKDYYNSPEALKSNKIFTSNGVWHRTGDGGFLDKDGHLNLVGRISKRFQYKGLWYYLFPLENALLSIEQIQIGTIVKINERAIAAIELKSNQDGSERNLREQVRQLNLPCDDIKIIKIPRDPRHNSKIDYHRLTSILGS